MDKKEFFEKEYMPKMHKLGQITGYLGVFMSFAPAVCLMIVYRLFPDPGALVPAFVSALSTFGFLWFVEPISYFSVLGPIGTYMAFLSGNISNMRVPCASMAQVAADVEPGTDEGSIISTIGMAVSVVINVSVLTVGVILGSSILSKLPEAITNAFGYLLPALFGAILVQFGMKIKGIAASVLAFSILMNVALSAGVFSWLPGANNYLGILTSVFLAIGIALMVQKKKDKEEKAE